MKLSPIAQWVTSAVSIAGGQAELARLVSKELRRDVDRAAVNKLTKSGRQLSADEMLAIEAVTGLPIPSPNVPIRVPVLDQVPAGKLADAASQLPVEDVPLLAYADLGPGEFFALTVAGTSMDRISPDGSKIIVNRADRALVGGKYYVFAVDGQVTYKRWVGDEPLRLAPYSFDPIHEPIFIKKKKGFEVIGRVKRTIFDL